MDLSKVVLTHHTLRNLGRQTLNLNHGEAPKLPPMDSAGSGSVQDKQKALLEEIIRKVNGLFEGELTDDDQLVYVNGVLKGKLLENDILVQQQQGTIRQLPRPVPGAAQRHHGRTGSAYLDEYPGARFRTGARRAEGYLAGASSAIGDLAR